MPQNSESFFEGGGGGGGEGRNEKILIGPKLQLIDYRPPTVYKASTVNNNYRVCNFSYKLIN